MNRCFAGAGKADIPIPKELLPLEKFEKYLDMLQVRVIYLKSNMEMLFVSYELTSIREYEIQAIRSLLAKVSHVDPTHIWISVTHTFSAPHTRSAAALQKEELKKKNERFCEILETAAVSAWRQAIDRLTEVQLSYGKGSCRCNCNRDIMTEQGYWLGQNPQGFSDHEVPIISIEDQNQHLLAILYSFDIQSSILDQVGQDSTACLISGDVCGKASRYIEEQTGAIAWYGLGAAGDQTPIKKARDVSEGIQLIEELGIELGDAVLQGLNDRQQLLSAAMQYETVELCCKGQKMPEQLGLRHPVQSYTYLEDGIRKTPITLWTMGTIAILAVQPELSSASASQLRHASPYALTIVLTMVNGGAKYMAEQKAYERFTYEARNSMFAKGSAEQLVEQALAMLQKKEGRTK